jgi:energy-coupling factor transporter transmembrane protein EcfT
MMEFNPMTSWPILIGILFLTALAGGIPIFLQSKNGTSTQRIWIKSGLLFLFLLFLGFFLLQPSRSISEDDDTVLVYSKEVNQEQVKFWKDSLEIKKVVFVEDYQETGQQVFLLEEQFSKESLYPFRNQTVRWILPESDRQLSDLSWKGYVRKGERQRINYRIFSEKDSAKLELRQGETELAGVKLLKGWNTGELEFQTAGQGKVEVPLLVDGDSLAFLRYFIGPAVSKKYHFQFSFPGQEVRVLSQWLESKGEKVSQEIRLSRATVLESGAANSDSLQIRLIDPQQLELKEVQDWVKTSEGALVIMNLSKPEETVFQVNRLFGTDFQLQRSGQGGSRTLGNQLEAAPFRWAVKSGQKIFGDDAMAVQRIGGIQIAISLYSATFPMFLQGDKAGYEAIWGELFGALEPAEPQSWKISAPVLSGTSTEIQLNQSDSIPEWIYSQVDSVNLVKALTNPFLAKGNFQLDSTGWIDFEDDFSIYVYGNNELQSIYASALIKPLTFRYEKKDASTDHNYSKISNWFWLIGMLLSLSLMWLEPKVSF